MKKGLASRLANPLIVGGMALALAVLAGLQYRWIGELSEAEKARLERTLEGSARRFRGDFNRRLQQFTSGLAPDLRGLTRDNYLDATARSLAGRRAESGFGVESAWLRPFGPGAAEVLRLSSDGASWDEMDRDSPDVPRLLSEPLRGGRRGFGGGFGGGRPLSWTFLAQGPFLVHPLVSFARDGERLRPDLFALLFVAPDLDLMRAELFPQLFADSFGEIDELRYQAVIVESGREERLIYSSDESARIEDFTRADVRLPLIWNREEADGRDRGDRPRGRADGWRHGDDRRPGNWRREERPRREPPPGGPDGDDGRRPPPDAPGPWGFDVAGGPLGLGSAPEWVFMVRHRAGSLDAVVSRLRRRNLIISGGILALLIAGMAAVLVSTRRAQRLAEMQMDFVAGVSHDLRTPLAVIRSAGDNLAEGVVAAEDQVREYGKLIRSEGRRLSGMVDQTLQFAAVQAGKRQYRLEPIGASELIRQAVDEILPTAEEAGFAVDLELPDELPMLQVDVSAASHCLQNLIGNAVKYGGEARWVGVAAREADGGVAVTVRDRGPGIDPLEAPRIFEPFFRGRRASEQQIKGSGLGLALARSDAEGFGGKLTMENRPGEGASFTLHLPGAKESETA